MSCAEQVIERFDAFESEDEECVLHLGMIRKPVEVSEKVPEGNGFGDKSSRYM